MPRPLGQTRERMLDAAADLFQRHGYDRVAVEDVTDAVGVRKPDLYNHFRDKAELYVAVRRRALDRLEAALDPLAASLEPGRERLAAAVGALLEEPAYLDAMRAREVETFLSTEARDFLFARSYAVLYRPLTALLRESGAAEDTLPFRFGVLVALATYFGPLTAPPDRTATAARISRMALL